jgi:ABC-type transport system involved in multi-copper enzyme maturation permease subunit
MGGLSARFRRIWAIAGNALLQALRQRSILVLVPYAIALASGALVLRQISVGQEIKILKDMALAAMDLFGSFAAIVMGVDLVTREIERKSAYPILARPVTRSEFILGKFFGLVAALAMNQALMVAIAWLVLVAMGDSPSWGLLAAPLGILLGLILTVAIALFFSVITNSVLASAFSIVLVLGGRFSDVIRNMAQVLPDIPSSVPRILYLALPNFQNFDFKLRTVYGDPVSPDALVLATLYCGLYSAILLVLASLAFDRKELV